MRDGGFSWYNKNMKKTIIILAILAILAGGAYLLDRYTSIFDFTRVENPPIINGDFPSGWMVYENETAGLEISYPPSCSEAETLSRNIVTFSCKGKDPTLQDTIGIRKIDVPAGKDFKDVIIENTIFDGSGLNPESWSEFKETKIGDYTFYKIRTGRFEANLSYSYYLVRGNMIYDFAFLSHGVVDWTDPNLDEEADSTHVILKQMLQTLKLPK